MLNPTRWNQYDACSNKLHLYFLFFVFGSFWCLLSSGNTKLISPHVKMNSLRQNAEIKPCFTLWPSAWYWYKHHTSLTQWYCLTCWIESDFEFLNWIIFHKTDSPNAVQCTWHNSLSNVDNHDFKLYFQVPGLCSMIPH